jgi:hypothetical protein
MPAPRGCPRNLGLSARLCRQCVVSKLVGADCCCCNNVRSRSSVCDEAVLSSLNEGSENVAP